MNLEIEIPKLVRPTVISGLGFSRWFRFEFEPLQALKGSSHILGLLHLWTTGAICFFYFPAAFGTDGGETALALLQVQASSDLVNFKPAPRWG